MALQHTRVTTQDFDRFIHEPENEGRLFEHINGEIIEVTPGRTRNSGIGHLITVPVHIFCRAQNLPCYTSGEGGAYRVQGNTVAPDFAYKQTPLSDDYPDPVPPLWAVEIISPTDKPRAVRDKRNIYLAAKILYWELYPETQTIDVYEPGKPPRSLGIDDMLDGGNVLPGFTLPVRELFPEGD
jgi:Uma2 family endonuclease